MFKRSYLFLVLFLLCAPFAHANNLAISNVTLTQDTGTQTYEMSFNVSWDNSWRDAMAASPTENWDASWVFCKFSKWSGTTWGDWAHCTLDTAVPAGQPANVQIDVATTPTEGKGAFISSADVGTGTVSWSSVKLTWKYGTDGVANDDQVKVKIFGIEMVYIPGGSFVVGDLDGPTDTTMINGFYTYGCTVEPCNYQIASEDAINLGTTNGYLWYRHDTTNDGDRLAASIPAAFPKGFAGFYMMKYELSQGQYRDFLNTLTRAQQASRVGSTITSGLSAPANNYVYVMSASAAVTYGNGVRSPASFSTTAPIVFGCQFSGTLNGDTDGRWIAANYVSWDDLKAYADWAALRPFTELEFEKAARGPSLAFNNEYAWGDATAVQATGVSNPGAVNELPTPATANIVYSAAFSRPLRVGSMAANGGNTRARAGGSYYGVMELGGNLWERPVTPARAAGRSFTGVHGDGDLTTAPANWPSSSGSGFRGGSWDRGASYARVSDRGYAAYGDSSRSGHYGARLARTSP